MSFSGAGGGVEGLLTPQSGDSLIYSILFIMSATLWGVQLSRQRILGLGESEQNADAFDGGEGRV